MQSEGMKVTCIDPTQRNLVTLENIEYRIGLHIQGAYENILEVGRCLIEAKEAGLVPHGQWEEWVRRNTGISERNAQKLMQAARCVSADSAMNRLPISKIQAILALPEAEREPMAEKATSESMSLRELQEEVRKQKERADQAEGKRLELERNLRSHDIQAANERKRLRAQLDDAENRAAQAATSTGISPEAQAEIDRLKSELADAESYAEQQAELRQKAQRDLLNQKAQSARGESGAHPGFDAGELAAAVRAFIGTAGVLPHLGVDAARISDGDRAQMRQYIDVIAAWVEGSRRALSTVVIGEDCSDE